MLASMVAAVAVEVVPTSRVAGREAGRSTMVLRNEDLEKLKQDLRSKKTTERKVRRRRRGGTSGGLGDTHPPTAPPCRDVRALCRGGMGSTDLNMPAGGGVARSTAAPGGRSLIAWGSKAAQRPCAELRGHASRYVIVGRVSRVDVRPLRASGVANCAPQPPRAQIETLSTESSCADVRGKGDAGHRPRLSNDPRWTPPARAPKATASVTQGVRPLNHMSSGYSSRAHRL